MTFEWITVDASALPCKHEIDVTSFFFSEISWKVCYVIAVDGFTGSSNWSSTYSLVKVVHSAQLGVVKQE